MVSTNAMTWLPIGSDQYMVAAMGLCPEPVPMILLFLQRSPWPIVGMTS